jgi:hypothetical protein
MLKTGTFTVLPEGNVRPSSYDPPPWHSACELLEGTKNIFIKVQEIAPDKRAELNS